MTHFSVFSKDLEHPCHEVKWHATKCIRMTFVSSCPWLNCLIVWSKSKSSTETKAESSVPLRRKWKYITHSFLDFQQAHKETRATLMGFMIMRCSWWSLGLLPASGYSNFSDTLCVLSLQMDLLMDHQHHIGLFYDPWSVSLLFSLFFWESLAVDISGVIHCAVCFCVGVTQQSPVYHEPSSKLH